MRLAAALVILALSAVPALAEDMVLFNYTGAATWSPEPSGMSDIFSSPDINAIPPSAAQPQAQPGQLSPESFADALAQGRALADSPEKYRDGLGVFAETSFEYVSERPARKKATGYIFAGTKFNLVRARAASAARGKKELPKEYVDKALAAEVLPVEFYVMEFEPGLMLLMQDGVVIRGEDGWAGLDPGLGVKGMVKSFPYGAIDFSKPLRVVVYDLDGNTYPFDVHIEEGR